MMGGVVVVADIDGTLVDAVGGFFATAEQIGHRVASHGGKLVLASARPPWSVARIAAVLGPAVSGIVALQGAAGQAREGEGWRTLWTVPLDPAVVEAVDAALDPELARWWYTDDAWTVSREDPFAHAEAAIVGQRWTAVDRHPPAAPALKLLAVGEPERIAVAAAAEAFVPGARAAVSKPFYLEVVADAVEVDKGIARVRAANPNAECVVALGDGPNDIGMLRAADIGFTFADAPPEVRAAATTVLPADRPAAYNALAGWIEERS
jgi:hydroxymethylpyrimidine pyrophosphatase-like HAD family hydrolase